jgi:hypothetical protein
MSNFEVEGTASQISPWQGIETNDLKIGRDGRLVLCYLFSLLIFQQTQKFAVWVPSDTIVNHGIFSGHKWGCTSFSLSKRSIASLYNANSLKGIASPSDWNLVGSKYSTFDDKQWNWETGSGFRDNIEESINLFWSYYRPQLEYDILAWNSLYFLTEISDRVRETINKIVSSFSDKLSEQSIESMIQGIVKKSNQKELSNLISSSVTKDQVRLSRYLQSLLASQNRDYPYLPSSCAVMPNQAMCLGTLCKINHLVKTPESGKKRIFALGMPSGLVEFLRNSAAEEMTDPRYNESNIIKITLWRRNLLDEAVCETPQEFLFDVSRFIVEGKNNFGIDPADASSQFFEGQTVKDLLKNTVITQFNRDGMVKQFKGKAYDDDVINEFDSEFNTMSNLVDVMGDAPINVSSSNALKQIFNNHVLDHYLKMYLKLTSGIDVSEDVFCFLEDETFIKGPDRNKRKLKNQMTEILTGMYDANDTASGITFQRVQGELNRSIILSPEKYRNRIVYPKIFDRVFCIVVDDADWVTPQPIEESKNTTISGIPEYENTMAESTSTSDVVDPQYFQYFITVSIMAEIDSIEGSVKSVSS